MLTIKLVTMICEYQYFYVDDKNT